MDRLNPRISLDPDPTMVADSDTRVPTQSAIRSYIGGLSYISSGDDALLSGLTIGPSQLYTAYTSLHIGGSIAGATTSYGVLADGEVKSGVTTAANNFRSTANTENASFTLTNYRHFQAVQGTFGASSTVTNQYGFHVSGTVVGATNNYGFFGDIASGTGRWNFYADGTAANYFRGATTFGTSFGYGTLSGVGGTVTQATSKSTGVTINKICGQITTHNASLGSGDSIAFRVTNSTVAATDIIMLSLASGGTAAAYDYGIDKVGSGYFDIYLLNYNGGGALAEALVINFVVIKSTTS